MSYINGSSIRELRENKKLTQKQLGDLIGVSDKAVSKWETEKGLPDITLIEPLSAALGVSVAELFSGENITNQNRAGNMKKTKFYVCPVCGNIIAAAGEGAFSCCGVSLFPQTAEKYSEGVTADTSDGDLYIHLDHPMSREHYISFFACVTGDTVIIKKLYPEQEAECRFPHRGRGKIYAYCNRHGLLEISF